MHIITRFSCFLLFLTAFVHPLVAQVQPADSVHLRSDSLTGFHLLDSVSPGYRVFITGENHTYLESNSRLWVQQIKYLHHNAGVRNVMIEYGYASGWLINQYIHSGDSQLFSILKDYSFPEYADAYRELWTFNQTLPDSDRVSVMGIDLERGVYSASKVLSLQLPKDQSAPDSIALDVESLLSLVKYTDVTVQNRGEDDEFFNSYSAMNTLNRIRNNFLSHSADWKSYLGDNYQMFARILKGFADMQTWRSYEKDNSTHQFVYREKYMYDRFREEFQTRQGNFFGQFGRCHSAKSDQEQTSCNWYAFKSLASRIEESLELGLKQKVMTLGILYADDRYDDDVWAAVQDSIDKLFESMPENRVVLYNLPADSGLHKVLRDYFDFVYLNTTKPSENYPYILPPDEEESIEMPEISTEARTKILGFAALMQLDLINLNQYLGIQEPYRDLQRQLGFEIVTNGDKNSRMHSNFSFGSLLKQQRTFNNEVLDRSYTMALRGFFINSFSAFNLTPNSRLIDIMPGFGWGYSQLEMRITEQDNNRDLKPEEGFLGYEKISKYINPAFTLSLCSELDFNFKWFTVGATGGYQFDLSKKRWIARELLREGPETSLTAWFAQFHVGVNFGGQSE